MVLVIVCVKPLPRSKRKPSTLYLGKFVGPANFCQFLGGGSCMVKVVEHTGGAAADWFSQGLLAAGWLLAASQYNFACGAFPRCGLYTTSSITAMPFLWQGTINSLSLFLCRNIYPAQSKDGIIAPASFPSNSFMGINSMALIPRLRKYFMESINAFGNCVVR